MHKSRIKIVKTEQKKNAQNPIKLKETYLEEENKKRALMSAHVYPHHINRSLCRNETNQPQFEETPEIIESRE